MTRGGYEVIFDGSRQVLRALALRRRRHGDAAARWDAADRAGRAESRRALVRRAAVRRLLAEAAVPGRLAGRRRAGQQRRAGAVPGAAAAGPGLPDDLQRQPAAATPRAAWIAVNCGHEIQINDSPDGPPFDPRKTGSIYGFADLNATQARVTPKGVWNDLEIRVVGQHYTVIRNGVVINEYENVPGVPFPGRPNDPDSSSRGLVGYIGLQAHGAPKDVVSFRNIRIKDLSDRD